MTVDKTANSMTETGVHCINDGQEMELVTGEIRYTCHYCGSVWEIEKGKGGQIIRVEVIFEGH